MPAFKLNKGQATPSVADFAVGGPLAAKIPGLTKVVGKSGVGFKRHPAIRALLDFLNEASVPAKDDTVANTFKHVHVPKTTYINAPEGFSLPKSMHENPARASGIKAARQKQTKAYSKFGKTNPDSFSAKLNKEPSAPTIRNLEDLNVTARSASDVKPKTPLLSRGLSGKSANHNKKLNETSVREIRGMKGANIADTAKKFSISEATVRGILKGDSWNWVK